MKTLNRLRLILNHWASALLQITIGGFLMINYFDPNSAPSGLSLIGFIYILSAISQLGRSRLNSLWSTKDLEKNN